MAGNSNNTAQDLRRKRNVGKNETSLSGKSKKIGFYKIILRSADFCPLPF